LQFGNFTTSFSSFLSTQYHEKAIEEFALTAPLPEDNTDVENEQLYDRKVQRTP